MRSGLGKECRKLFRKMMATQFPEYQEDKGQIVPQDWYVWTRQNPSGVWLQIRLVIHNSRDQFTIETGWGFQGQLPQVLYPSITDIFDKPCIFRMNRLWSGKDYWWPLVLHPEEFERAILYRDDPIEQCLPLVAPAVWDAAEKLKDHLIPVFDKIIQLQTTSHVRDT